MRPLQIAAIAMGTVGLLLVAFLAVGFALPSTWEAERSTWIGADPEEIFPHLDSAERWQAWTPSPDSGVEMFGPEAGEGSGRRWDDPGYGKGEFVVTESDPPRAVSYDVDVEDGSIRIQGRLLLEAEDGGTRVRWTEAGNFGWNPLMGYLAFRMSDLQGFQLEASLTTLRRLIEEGQEFEPEAPIGTQPITGSDDPGS